MVKTIHMKMKKIHTVEYKRENKITENMKLIRQCHIHIGINVRTYCATRAKASMIKAKKKTEMMMHVFRYCPAELVLMPRKFKRSRCAI